MMALVGNLSRFPWSARTMRTLTKPARSPRETAFALVALTSSCAAIAHGSARAVADSWREIGFSHLLGVALNPALFLLSMCGAVVVSIALARSHARAIDRWHAERDEHREDRRCAERVVLSRLAAISSGVVRVRGRIVEAVPVATPRSLMVAAFDEGAGADDAWRAGGVLVLDDGSARVRVDARRARVSGGRYFDDGSHVSVGDFVEVVGRVQFESSDSAEAAYRERPVEAVIGALDEDGVRLSVLTGSRS